MSLKTLGLLTLMVMCGMLIPVSDMSRVSVYNNILVDIGDEQSIAQSLSTFSSHMVNIIDIMKRLTTSRLFLLMNSVRELTRLKVRHLLFRLLKL